MASRKQTRVIRDPKLHAEFIAMTKRTYSNGVEVGVITGTGEHPNATGGQTIAEVAAWNEFGTSRAPERSFIRSTMHEQRHAYLATIAALMRRVLRGDITARRAAELLGLQAQSDVRDKITSLREPPNADSTAAKKGSDNPLIDTGQLRKAIAWKEVTP